MAPYFDGDWYHHGLDDFPLLCPASPLALLSAQDYCPPIAAAPPPAHLIGRTSIDGSYCHGALDAAADCPPSALMNLREHESYYDLPLFCLPPPAAGDPYFSINQLPPVLPADTATVMGLDDAPLLPLGDIDLEAFDNAAANEHTPPRHDGHAMTIVPVPPPADHQHSVSQEYAGLDDDGYAEQKHMVIADCFLPGANAFESAARQLAPPPPPPPRGRRSGAGRSHRSPSAPAFGKTRLDHIGFEELRKYFYMPITRAAREMNVGLTVLKKRCRELGIARWPHRKMKSLKSLILNVQEMAGAGMNNPAAVRQELEALETYCALMEENPAIELTERTKKLRQACFKESYKRRRAAAVSVVDHIFSFGDHHQYHHQLPPSPSSADEGHGQGSGIFGY
ncbi:unnamed protein product [Urochloa decumbens]|uniref:RWP-RK domain-containing protein n=1 Tax=Urochloa decumbens TaxID=240449 RepID=A0ABC8ZPD8_9POAL